MHRRTASREMALILFKGLRISENYNNFFNPHVCHVCKCSVQEKLRLCSSCHMISYCSDDHRLLHSDKHNEICEAIVKLSKRRNIRNTREITSDEWLAFRKENIKSVMEEIHRSLELYEEQMFWFAISCFVCHKQNHSLTTCLDCLSVDRCHEHDFNRFAHDCLYLQQALKQDIYEIPSRRDVKIHYMCMPFLRTDITSIESYIEESIIIHRNMKEWYDEDYTFSDNVSAPLTLCFAMNNNPFLTFEIMPSIFVIHILAGATTKQRDLSTWEILSHCMGAFRTIVIVMVGSELQDNFVKWRNCPTCCYLNKQLFFEYHSTLYHDYMQSKQHIPSNMIIGYHLELEKLDTQTIRAVKGQNCSLLLTVKSKKSTLDYITKLQAELNETVKPYIVNKNYFRSNRPYRDYEDDVFFRNNYLIMYQNLNDSFRSIEANSNLIN